MSKECVVYDIETTGLSNKNDEITQFSAVKVRRDATGKVEYLAEFNRYCKTVRPVPKEVTELTGITDETLQRLGIPVAQAMKEFEAFVGNATLVAHNGKRFDSKFLRREMAAANINYDHTEIDSMLLAKALWKDTKHSISVLIDYLGLEQLEAHRADNDVKMTAEIFAKEMEELARRARLDRDFAKACLANASFNTKTGK